LAAEQGEEEEEEEEGKVKRNVKAQTNGMRDMTRQNVV